MYNPYSFECAYKHDCMSTLLSHYAQVLAVFRVEDRSVGEVPDVPKNVFLGGQVRGNI